MDKTNTQTGAPASWAPRHKIWFRCRSCSEVHRGLPEISFELPEPIASLTKSARRRRVLLDGDIAILDGNRYFLRASLSAAVVGSDHHVTWGVWVEASWTRFKSYWLYLSALEGAETAGLRPFAGRLENTITGFGATRGLTGTVMPPSGGERPTFVLGTKGRQAAHPLVLTQQQGVAQSVALEQARRVGVLMLVT